MKRFEKEDDIRKFVCEMHRYEMEQLPAKETLEKNYRLSETFFAKMRRLVERMTRRERRKRREQYVAAAAVIALLLFGMANPSVVAQTFAGIWEWFTDHVEIHFKEEDTGLTMVPEYTLSYVPEGVALVNEMYGEHGGLLEYSGEDTLLVFDYMPSDGISNVNNENVRYSTLEWDDGTVLYCFESEGDADNLVMWLSEDDKIVFQISSNLSMDEILKIYESVQKKIVK